MRLAVLESSVDDARTERAIAVALSTAPERLLLFGAAAHTARRLAARDVARRDERFLDVAAAWILDAPAGAAGEPPTRASLPVPLVEVAVAVTRDDVTPLVASARVIELCSGHICMAVPDAPSLELEEIENAALWIAGGASASVESNKGRLVVVPGDVIAGGSVVVMDTSAHDVKIARVDTAGAVVDARTCPLGGGSRMQVQGARAGAGSTGST
jgi:hypothetical protein